MDDMEKVLEGIRCCMAIRQVMKLCDECPYRNVPYSCEAVLGSDTLYLLERQKPVEPRWTHPTVDKSVLMCGGCGIEIPSGKPNYCPWCGKKVKWDA